MPQILGRPKNIDALTGDDSGIVLHVSTSLEYKVVSHFGFVEQSHVLAELCKLLGTGIIVGADISEAQLARFNPQNLEGRRDAVR